MSDYRRSAREKITKAAWYRRRAQEPGWLEKRAEAARAWRRKVTEGKIYDPFGDGITGRTNVAHLMAQGKERMK